MHWCDRRTAIALLGRELEALGWKLYGWKEDRSDSMTDYFDPESWQGIGTKGGGFVVVVDCDRSEAERLSGKGPAKCAPPSLGPCTPCGGTGEEQRDVPGSVVRDILGGGVERRPARKAGDPCAICDGTGEREESRGLVYDDWPTFQGNPSGRKWHVEKGGAVLKSGIGLKTCLKRDESWPEDEYGHKRRVVVNVGARSVALKIDRHTKSRKDRAAAEGPRELAAGVVVEMRENDEHDGVELHFAEKPPASIRDRLKLAAPRWRWSRFSSCWYAKRTPISLAFARALVSELTAEAAGTLTRPGDEDHAAHEETRPGILPVGPAL